MSYTFFRKEVEDRMCAAYVIQGGDSSKPDWPVPQINLNLCDGCGLCVKVCPNHVLKIDQGKALVAFPQCCNYSGLCEQACPTHAITRIFEIILQENADHE